MKEDSDQALGSSTKPATKYRLIIEQSFEAYMIKNGELPAKWEKVFKQRHSGRYCVDDDKRTALR
jgi:hypothetical protein